MNKALCFLQQNDLLTPSPVSSGALSLMLLWQDVSSASATSNDSSGLTAIASTCFTIQKISKIYMMYFLLRTYLLSLLPLLLLLLNVHKQLGLRDVICDPNFAFFKLLEQVFCVLLLLFVIYTIYQYQVRGDRGGGSQEGL